MLWNWGTGADAARSTLTDAVEFYHMYGGGKIVFSEGAFYYSSRGREGNPKGVRYGVLGQKFTIEMENGQCCTIGIALESGDSQGSCKRISYVKKDGYCYSLYQVSYDRIFKRMQERYPKIDLSQSMYNQKIRFQIDFLLTLVVNGQEKGKVEELDKGQLHITGTAYQSLEEIQDAADWSEETRDALENYYEIQMQVFQPSIWYVEYDKNHKSASGTMEKQAFTYGKEEKLAKCFFRNVIMVNLDPVDGTWRGEKLETVHKMLKSQFQGWSLTPDGQKKYEDQAWVKNLSDQQGAQVLLYALWSGVEIVFPDCRRDDCDFLGWSTKKYDTLSAGSEKAELEEGKIYRPGDRYRTQKNRTFYAVWRWKRYKVQFREPDEISGDLEQKIYHYDRKAVQEIRELIESCGFAGARLNQELARRESS